MTTTPRRALAAAAALAVAGVALAGCVRLPASGPRVTEQHEVSDDVHALRLENAGDVVVELGNEPGLTVRAPDNVIDRLTVDEEGGTIVLGIEGPGMWTGRIDYVLTVRSFDGVEIEGAGDVRADFSAAREVSIDIEGSGDVRAEKVDAEEVSIEIVGSGDVRIAGRAERGDYRIEGSGDIRAADLVLRTGAVEVVGSGDISVHATSSLSARVAGSGDIRIAGSPRVTRDIEGSGDILEF